MDVEPRHRCRRNCSKGANRALACDDVFGRRWEAESDVDVKLVALVPSPGFACGNWLDVVVRLIWTWTSKSGPCAVETAARVLHPGFACDDVFGRRVESSRTWTSNCGTGAV